MITSEIGISARTWVDLDVTKFISGEGVYSLALTTTGTTAVSIASKESGGSEPQLIV